MSRLCKMGIIYQKSNKYWNIDLLLNRLTKYEPKLKLQLIAVREYDKNKKLKELLPKGFKMPSDLDAVATLPVDVDYVQHVIKYSKNLKWVHSMFAGVDRFLKDETLVKNHKITLTNTRGAYAESLAEFSVHAMLYFNYHTPQYIDAYSKKKWIRPVNIMLKGRTLTLVGYGNNAIALAKKAKVSFDMHVIAVTNAINELQGKEYTDEIVEIQDLDSVLPRTDFLVSTLPHTKETMNYYNYERFKKLKPSSVFVNIGRGSAVVEADLAKALQDKLILGAVLDVNQKEPLEKDSPLYDFDESRILLTCHSADHTDQYFAQAVNILEKNIVSYLKTGRHVTIVDKLKGY